MAELKARTVTPPVAEGRFAFSILVPIDWQQPEVPTDAPDFTNATAMMGLSIFVSQNPNVPILLTISGRPGYEDGAVMQWAKYIVQSQEMTIKTCMPVRLAAHEGIEITCTQEADPNIGEMTILAVFVEDGGNLFLVTTMAPTKIYAEFEPDFARMRESFTLLAPQGSTKPLVEGGPVPAPREKKEEKPKAEKKAAPKKPSKQESQKPPAPTTAESEPAPENTGPDFRPFILDDATALDENDTINARFRDTGNGLVVRVQQTNPERGYAVIGSGALEALFAVPLGWHVVDDGRRTLIFDRQNVGQVNLTYINIDGQSPDDIFTAIIQDLARENPNVEHRVLDLGGNPSLGVRNLVINGEALQQCYMLVRHPHKENVAVKVRVTADENNIPKLLDMTGEMLKYIQFMK